MSQLYGLYGFNNPYVALYHHGILGQKWGVRRYQNYDGTYTQKGLSRYNKSKDAYEKAKASGDKNATKIARKQMKADYKQLKKDYDADKGKKLLDSGHTIQKERLKKFTVLTGTALADAGFKALSEKGRQYTLITNSGKNVSLNKLSSTTVSAGMNIVSAIVTTKANKNIKQLNAYYEKIGKRPLSEQNTALLGINMLTYGNQYKKRKKR